MAKASKRRRQIAENRKARREFEILERLEAGLCLLGSEVKSLRSGKGNITEAFVRFANGEAWLVEAHISPYPQAGRFNHEPRRQRKLLLKRKELDRWTRRVNERGLAVIPLSLYFEGPWVKVELGLGKGRKLHDKRHVLKERTDQRDMARALRHG